MAQMPGVIGNVPVIKKSWDRIVGLGEGMVGNEFIMTFEGNDNVRFLVQTSQFPALQRANVETYGPHGVMFRQQAWYQNAQDISVSFKETIKGHAYQFLRSMIQKKLYITIKLAAAGESYLNGNPHAAVILYNSWIELDAADLSVEDGTSLVKPSGTIHANWVSWCDNDTPSGAGLTFDI